MKKMMRTNKMKKILLGLVAVGMVLCTAACGNKNQEEEEDLYEYIAKSNLLMFDKSGKEAGTSVISIDKDSVKYLEIQYDDSFNTDKVIYHNKSVNEDKDETQELKVPDEVLKRENTYINRVFRDKEGNLYNMSNSYDPQTDEESIFMDIYKEDGSYISTTDLSKAKNEIGLSYISDTLMDNEGNFYFTGDGGIGVTDSQGKVICKISMNGWVDNIFVGGDGLVYVSFYDYSGETSKYDVKSIDVKAQSLKDTKISLSGSSSRYWKACDETHAFSYNDNKVSIVDFTTGEEEGLWNWMDIDYINVYPEGFWKNDDGSYGFAVRDYSMDGVEQLDLVTVKKELITSENQREKVVFGVKSYIDESTKSAIQKFNKTNGKYKVVLKNYYDEYDYQNADAMLKADISAGKVDLIVTDLLDLELVRKNTFEDLSNYVANDPNLKSEELFTNIFESSKIKGKQYFVSPSFSIITLIGNADKVGKNSSWTLDDFVKLRKENPDSDFMSYATKESILSYFIYYCSSSFIDNNNNTCDFTSEDFKKVLEIVKSFPDEIDYENYDDWDLISKGDIFMSMLYLSDVDSITSYKKIFNDNANVIGFPTGNDSGHMITFNSCYSILSNSKHKDGAWAFISSLFEDGTFSEASYLNGFPIKKKTFEAVMKNRLEWSGGGSIGNGSTIIEIPKPDQSTIDEIRDIIEKADNMVLFNEKIYDIISEEVDPYFANSKTLDETCDTIQKRVNLYLSETR